MICFSNRSWTKPYIYKAGLFQTMWLVYRPWGIWSSGPPTAEYPPPSFLFWPRQSPSLAEASVLQPPLHRAVPLGPVNTNTHIWFMDSNMVASNLQFLPRTQLIVQYTIQNKNISGDNKGVSLDLYVGLHFLLLVLQRLVPLLFLLHTGLQVV